MLLKHCGLYFLASGVPGVLNLLALALFTRILGPDDYGRYALVVAGVGLADSLLFHWLQMGLLRFLRADQGRREAFLSTVLGGFLAITAFSVLAGGAAWLIVGDPQLKRLILLGLLFLWTQSFFTINQEITRSRLSPLLYGVNSVAKAAVALGVGWAGVRGGWGAEGLILGVIAGLALPLLWLAPRYWKGVRPGLVEGEILKKLLAYGLPLTANFALVFIINSSDRFLLGYLMGADAAGIYSVGYNFAQQTLVILMMVVNLAAYPLAVRALEESGEEAARRQVGSNGRLLLMVACPAAAGMACLAPNISGVFLGSAFSRDAAALIPWIALSAFLAGVKAYHFDLSFQLSRRTLHQVWVVLVAAVVNLALNLWWIPKYGIAGAAYATVAAYAIGVVLSWRVGKRVFPIPLPVGGTVKILVATAAMVVALVPLRAESGPVFLAIQVAWGALAYGGAMLILHREEIRDALRTLPPQAKGMQAFKVLAKFR